MIVNCLSVLYVLNWLYSLVVIVVAIKETGQFSYLDTLISETNETFRIVVGANIVKAGVENIFKYNDFGGKGSRYMGTSNSENENIENSGGQQRMNDIIFVSIKVTDYGLRGCDCQIRYSLA